MSDKRDQGTVFTVEMDDKQAAELFAALKASGMRAVTCTCGREFLTREESNLCPPCRGLEG